MRHLVLPILACIAICLSDAETAFSKGGPGRGGGNGRGRSSAQGGNRGNGGGRPTTAPQNRGGGNRPTSPGRPQSAGGPTTRPQQGRPQGAGAPRQTDASPTAERLTGREHALDVQRGNEQRKLDHRLQTSERLRENAARNGNQNLLDTADRMDQRAYEHYESRLNRINGNIADTSDLPDDVTDLTTGDNARLLQTTRDRLGDSTALDSDDVTNVLDGQENSLTRRLANEERKLQQQLDVAQQLRDISARNGNENLIQTAERMEQTAVTRYEQQFEKLAVGELDPGTFTDAVETVVE